MPLELVHECEYIGRTAGARTNAISPTRTTIKKCEIHVFAHQKHAEQVGLVRLGHVQLEQRLGVLGAGRDEAVNLAVRVAGQVGQCAERGRFLCQWVKKYIFAMNL